MSDHKRVVLDATQRHTELQMREAIYDHFARLNKLGASAIAEDTELKTLDFGIFKAAQHVPNGNISVCAHCMFMLIHTLRETADLVEDAARRLDIKEPAFDQWQKPK